MELNLNNKTALITGASKGIGKAIAESMANEGCNLILTARSTDKLNEAISHYQEVIKLRPEQAADFYNKIGAVHQKLGDAEKAVTNFQEGLIKRSGIDFEKEEKLRPATTYFFLELTNKCNFHCEFCPSDLQTRSQGFMDFSLVKKVFA